MTTPIKLIAVDMDGTLLDEHGQLPPDVLPIVKEVEGRGQRFTLISGRPIIFMQHIAEALAITTPMVAFNGGALFENGRIIASAPFSMAPLRPVLEEADRRGATVLIYTATEAFALTETEWVIKNKTTIRRYTIITPTFEMWQRMQVLKIALLYHHDEAIWGRIDPLLDPFEGTYAINRYGSRLCEIMDRGVNKARGLAQLAALLKIPLEEVLAIGDDVNDREMLKEAGIGVAVNNATESAKAASDHVTEGSNTAGVIEAIRRYS